MSPESNARRLSRRQSIKGNGLAGVAVAQLATTTQAQEAGPRVSRLAHRYLTLQDLKADVAVQAGDWAETHSGPSRQRGGRHCAGEWPVGRIELIRPARI